MKTEEISVFEIIGKKCIYFQDGIHIGSRIVGHMRNGCDVSMSYYKVDCVTEGFFSGILFRLREEAPRRTIPIDLSILSINMRVEHLSLLIDVQNVWCIGKVFSIK